MKKIWNVAIKDLKVAFRDPTALIMMLLTPFAITLAIGFAFGGFDRSSTPQIEKIPVIIVNNDKGEFGQQLVDVFHSEDLETLLEPAVFNDESEARSSVDRDESAAAVIIPEDLTESILPADLLKSVFSQAVPERKKTSIEVYVNPTRTVGSGIVRSVVERYLNQIQAGSTGGQVTVVQMLKSSLVSPEQMNEIGENLGRLSGMETASAELITTNARIGSSEQSSASFDWLTYIAPSMAIVSLMFTVAAGGRSILAERQWGTLPRLLVTPSTPLQVLAGKALGIFLTGTTQMTILIIASWLLFRLQWGDWTAVAALVASLAAAATGWGLLLAAFARSVGEAGAAGNALALIFAAAAGNFIPRMNLPEWLQAASFISPNAWGLEGFTLLSQGASLIDILPFILGLLVMGAALMLIATFVFRRQYR